MLDPKIIVESILKDLNLDYVKEFKFCKTRKWRADYYIEQLKVLFEIDGAVWRHGRHTRGQGFINDCEKLNTASILGYTVLRYPTDVIRKSPQKIVEDLNILINKLR